MLNVSICLPHWQYGAASRFCSNACNWEGNQMQLDGKDRVITFAPDHLLYLKDTFSYRGFLVSKGVASLIFPILQKRPLQAPA
jgi:hypothetical protein